MKKYIYPSIVATISAFVLIFLPMLGSTAEVKANYPDTPQGWIFWATVRVILCGVNLIFLYCFTHQGQENASRKPQYAEAMAIMGESEHERAFRSPARWKAEQYGKKGVSTVAMTALSLFALSSAVLMYDWIALITYTLSILIGVAFGLMSMKSAEKYWSEEFPLYVKKHYTGGDHENLR